MTLAYDGLAVRVESPERASLAWLREFLTPAFSLAEATTVDRFVELIVDDRGYADILARGQRVSRQFECFALDRGTIRLPLWATTPTERLLYDGACRVFYCIDADAARVRVVSAALNLAARFALMRVVREFAMNAARTAPRLLIHGAAFALSVGGVILAGTKAAGKTSLLIHALRCGGARFVSNDRVVVALDDTEPVLRGMPTVVTIRPQTLTLFPDLQTPLLKSGYDHRLALGESAPAGARTAPPRPLCPIDLSPAQFCRQLGVDMCGHSPLRALVFPTLTRAHADLRIRRLSPQAAAERLDDVLFGAEPCSATSEVFTVPESTLLDRARLQALASTLIARVPALECELGPEAYQKSGALAELINRVLSS